MDVRGRIIVTHPMHDVLFAESVYAERADLCAECIRRHPVRDGHGHLGVSVRAIVLHFSHTRLEMVRRRT